MLQERMVLPVGVAVRDKNGERYIVEAVLGVGGFSAVYKVRDKRTGQRVHALKEVINPNEEERQNLAREAELLMRLNHPTLPRVYQVFEHVQLKRLYLLMDYIEGTNLETLRREQAENSFSLEFILALMAPIVRAINYLHTQTPPIIHRDIKPANIIVPKGAGDAMLVDFGLAKEYVEDKTTNILRYGTPGYAAPEQYAQGTNLRTDVYGLGAALYTLLTGHRPVDALIRIVDQKQQDPLERADQISAKVPASVGKVLARAMSLRIDDRFASVEEFWRAFCFAVEHPEDEEGEDEAMVKPPAHPEEINTLPLSREKKSQAQERSSSAKKRVLVIGLLLVLLGTGGGLAFWLFRQNSHAPPIVVKRPSSIVVANACTPPTVSEFASSPYPVLVPCYAGTISDIGVAKVKTGMYLTAIKQKQNSLSGQFRGLNIAGSFQGTIQLNGDMKFVVMLPGRSDTLVFTGSSKFGGDMVGTFELQDKNGQATADEYGSWDAHPQ